MKHIQHIIFYATFLLSPQCFAGNGAWELEKNEDGIKIYTRTVDGENIREFKALTTIAASRKIIAKIIKPITIRLFPDVPVDHPAMGSIVLNMAANMLGLGNAATPLGLKAMKELQELNEQKDTATDAMCTFLAINTSSVQIILPATVVGLMGASSSEIFITTIFATSMSTIAAIFSVKFLSKMDRFKIRQETK